MVSSFWHLDRNYIIHEKKGGLSQNWSAPAKCGISVYELPSRLGHNFKLPQGNKADKLKNKKLFSYPDKHRRRKLSQRLSLSI